MKTQRDTDKKVIALIKLGEKVLDTTTDGHQKQYINEKKFHDFRISALSFLSVTFGDHSPFYKEFYKEVTTPTPVRCERALGILSSVQREVQGDWLTSMRSEIFNVFERDMLSIAKKQALSGKKKSALILAASLLDNHLQNFSTENGMSIMRDVGGKLVPFSSVQLNSRAYKKGLYDRKINKRIFAWIELAEASIDLPDADIEVDAVTKAIDNMTGFFVEYPTKPVE